ncbi:hypothetical protein FHS29_003369 [Saccharothrix tamanrassetensis]|uniref:Uncharacterized protein n=1 Tax=Saccharothrix tamanrassetensis TaxID=1051531 RepID=A0A841CMJ3_9PSEU|nr:hypothetical protein [Saccharothrix tamanrassetensis]MBB5956776.1 hypothetical protein [Saccharothrix tamanrassetensis]
MNTELVSRTGLVPEQANPIPTSPADALEVAVERVLAAVRPSNLADPLSDPLSGALTAEQSLRDALRRTEVGSDDALGQAVACAEAAAEHLRYLELQEARLLLVAARGQLVRSHSRRP